MRPFASATAPHLDPSGPADSYLAMDSRAGGIRKEAAAKQRPARLAALRLWLELHPFVGLARGALLIAVTFGLLVWLLAPVGPSKVVYGVVTSMGMSESEHGSFPTAMVRVEGRDVRVSLERYQLCGRGDRIRLLKRRIRMGGAYVAARYACGR